MRNTGWGGQRLYRLEVDGAPAKSRVVEVAADGALGAFLLAGRLDEGRDVAIFEDGRPLARVRRMAGSGAWVINPPVLASPPASPGAARA